VKGRPICPTFELVDVDRDLLDDAMSADFQAWLNHMTAAVLRAPKRDGQ
jgi:hypothetical protein